jgi:hypothetical protein
MVAAERTRFEVAADDSGGPAVRAATPGCTCAERRGPCPRSERRKRSRSNPRLWRTRAYTRTLARSDRHDTSPDLRALQRWTRSSQVTSCQRTVGGGGDRVKRRATWRGDAAHVLLEGAHELVPITHRAAVSAPLRAAAMTREAGGARECGLPASGARRSAEAAIRRRVRCKVRAHCIRKTPMRSSTAPSTHHAHACASSSSPMQAQWSQAAAFPLCSRAPGRSL